MEGQTPIYQIVVDRTIIGQRISECRFSAGWTQHQLAKRLGTNSHTIESWEQFLSLPSLENLLKLCAVFHTTPNYLLGYDAKHIYVLDSLDSADQDLVRGILQLILDRNSKTR